MLSDEMGRLKSALADRYAIEHELGAGGMATVYLAEDLKHERKVAVKVLRPELAAVLGAERFLNEIKVTANLQHPHILPLHDSGEADSFLYYVMPYVDGESLREKLNREKQLAIDEAIEITKAVASALDYAHRHNVIHRDIKPENILLHDGQALVADFGIALAVRAAAGERLTETGISLGTPHYMSPEQVTGERGLTGKSDLYSLGCVTYEMLVGEPPYTGPTAQAIIAKVVTAEPQRIGVQRNTVPPHVEAAVHTALAKLPADRFATGSQFLDALTRPSAAIAPLTTPMPGPTLAAALVRPRVLATWQLALLVALAVVAGGAAFWAFLRPTPSAQAVRFVVPLETDRALGVFNPLALPPDGTRLVYAAEPGGGPGGERLGPPRLYLRGLDRFEATPIPGTEGAVSPFFSPDGQWVGFFADGKLKKVAVTGGAPLTICDAASGANASGSWGRNSTITFSEGSGGGLFWVSAEGGEPETLTTVDREKNERHSWPHILPNGKRVLFTSLTRPEGMTIAVLSLETLKWRSLMPGIQPMYVPTGHLIYSREAALLAVPFDLERAEVSGSPVTIVDTLRTSAGPNIATFALSQTGSLVYVPGGGSYARNQLVWVDRQGQASPLTDERRSYVRVALSPGGKRVALSDRAPMSSDIWIYEVERSTRTRLTFEGNNFTPAWTPDGERVSFASDRSGRPDLYWKTADGTGPAEPLVIRGDRLLSRTSWSPNGNVVAFQAAEGSGGTGADIWTLELEGDRVPTPLLSESFNELMPAFSPGGRALAYVSDESGQREVYARPYPGPGAKTLISEQGGSEPRWARDGSELFYRNGDRVMAVAVQMEPEFAVGRSRLLFEGSYAASYDVSPDGRRFLMIRVDEQAAPTAIHVALNWFEELKAMVGN